MYLKRTILSLLLLIVILGGALLVRINGGSYEIGQDGNSDQSSGVNLEQDELNGLGYEKYTHEYGNFTLEYPDEFYVSKEDGDLVEFSSSDGKVVFAVYSPLWFGDENVSKIYIQPNERLLSSESEEEELDESEVGPATRMVITQSYIDKQERYTRELVDYQLHGESSSTRKAFSFEYADEQIKDEYMDEFEYFKESLIQFAD